MPLSCRCMHTDATLSNILSAVAKLKDVSTGYVSLVTDLKEGGPPNDCMRDDESVRKRKTAIRDMESDRQLLTKYAWRRI